MKSSHFGQGVKPDSSTVTPDGSVLRLTRTSPSFALPTSLSVSIFPSESKSTSLHLSKFCPRLSLSFLLSFSFYLSIKLYNDRPFSPCLCPYARMPLIIPKRIFSCRFSLSTPLSNDPTPLTLHLFTPPLLYALLSFYLPTPPPPPDCLSIFHSGTPCSPGLSYNCPLNSPEGPDTRRQNWIVRVLVRDSLLDSAPSSV